MEAFIARQPIFDRRMGLFGYELLYRRSSANSAGLIDDDQATTELIRDSCMVFGLGDLTGGAKAFINFSKSLIDSDMPLLLPKDGVVLEILEREEATDATIEACKRIRSMGYTIALDDFIFEKRFLPLIELADIIKVEYPAVELETQAAFIRKYRGKVKFLAEKIETRAEFKRAAQLGYDYFQGYFFSKPSVIKSKEIVSLNANLFRIMEELNRPEPSFDSIAAIIRMDLGLAYKLLKLSNSIYHGARNEIVSINHALTHIGLKEIAEWVTLILLKDIQNVENAELIKLCLIRAKLMERIAAELGLEAGNAEYFFCGLFSAIDVLLNRPMAEILDGLPLPDRVKRTLKGEDSDQRRALDCILACENSNWYEVGASYPLNQISAGRYMELYLEALKWANSLNDQ